MSSLNPNQNVHMYRVEYAVKKRSYDSFTSLNEWAIGFGRTYEEASVYAQNLVCKIRDYKMRDDEGNVIGPDLNRIDILGTHRIDIPKNQIDKSEVPDSEFTANLLEQGFRPLYSWNRDNNHPV